MRAWRRGALCLTWALAGCALPRDTIQAPPAHAVQGAQLIVDGDAPLPQQQPLIDELTALRHVVATKMQLPASGEPVYLKLVSTMDRWDSFVRREHPDLLHRRAFFVVEGSRLRVYACCGERVVEDLRHEVTHGYLQAMVPHLPLWLDEGLAEYFEVPPHARGINPPHITLLLARWQDRQWAPDLPRLERLRSSQAMTQQDYAESWAWVQFLLDSSPPRREWLCHYLVRLRGGAQAPPLSSFLATAEPDAAQALVDHLQQLEAARKGSATTTGRRAAAGEDASG